MMSCHLKMSLSLCFNRDGVFPCLAKWDIIKELTLKLLPNFQTNISTQWNFSEIYLNYWGNYKWNDSLLGLIIMMMVTDWNNLSCLAKIKKHISFRNEISFFQILFCMPNLNVCKPVEFHYVFSIISEPADKNFKTWNKFVKIGNLIGSQGPYFFQLSVYLVGSKNVQIHFGYWIESVIIKLDKITA